MTRKDYVAFANHIKNLESSGISPKLNLAATKSAMAAMMIQVCKADNPKFDEVIFLKACGLTEVR